ncbi:hypothetical protein GQ43DRAFT_493402 [Delitschia confertaspora ATCC 74209]|uniref:Uncharacterized protein n=1 Tax=Delitschia confertaspora ATCC 74209 TaxID=1513339 RepID=A0A9P4MW07_9PLEO|nr:hypothetical protein GQ43DRAFT_493402 [Delitschia confertaspora ATCC 74209]
MGYMIAGMMMSFIVLAAVSLTYYGWWQLGREVSMSPFETAKVIDVPILRATNSNILYKTWPVQFGSGKVMYGEDELGRFLVRKRKTLGGPRLECDISYYPRNTAF